MSVPQQKPYCTWLTHFIKAFGNCQERFWWMLWCPQVLFEDHCCTLIRGIASEVREKKFPLYTLIWHSAYLSGGCTQHTWQDLLKMQRKLIHISKRGYRWVLQGKLVSLHLFTIICFSAMCNFAFPNRGDPVQSHQTLGATLFPLWHQNFNRCKMEYLKWYDPPSCKILLFSNLQ